MIEGKILLFCLCPQSLKLARVHIIIYELIWFKLGMIVDSIELYILILVSVTLTLIQGHSDAWSKTFYTSYITKFSTDLDGIWYTFETCCSVKLHAYLILLINIQMREAYLRNFTQIL